MAGKTQKLIEEINQLRQALRAAKQDADALNASIQSTAKTGVDVRATSRTGSQTFTTNPQSVEREAAKIMQALEGQITLKSRGSLGSQAQYSPGKVLEDIKKDLANQLKEIRGTSIPTTGTIGGTPVVESTANITKLQDMRNYLEVLKKDWIALTGSAEGFDKIFNKIVGNDVNNLEKMEKAAAKARDKLAELEDIWERTGAVPAKTTGTPAAQTGGTASRPANLKELIADAEKLRQAMVDNKIPLGDFDKILKEAMDTGDVKVFETALRQLIQNFNDLTSAANKASQATQGVGKVDVTAGQNLRNQQQPLNTDEDFLIAQNKASNQVQESLRKQASMMPLEFQSGAQQLGEQYVAGLNQRISAIAKLEQAQATLNNTQAKEVQYVDNAVLKTKKLQGGVVELTASFRAQNQEVQKGSKYYKDVGGVWEELANASDKLTIAQRRRVAESASRGDADTAALKKQADKYKFDIEENLKSVETESTTGITRYRLQKPITKLMPDPKTGEMVETFTGAFEKLNVTLDKNGVLLNDTQKRFRSFGDAIVRDIGEVLKWSVAVGLVYGGMQKLQQMIQLAIDNQTKLVDITIALGNAQRSTSDIFKDAATIAQASGESITGVLESYTLAYRAAGDIADPLERTAAANKFLSDSLVLSKLSTLDQAASLDTLSGALKQTAKLGETTEEMFTRSTKLLDTWVATTKAANVDMATLATAFSITSESAENAGLSIEELNAVIAVMSEKIGALGPKETGNTVRALIGGIYSQNAAQELAKFGITVQDASGKTRGFLDIMTQLYQLNQKKIIDDDQLNKLALALGGGVRRGQQYLAFITGLGRVNEVVAAQTDVNGQAQAALAQQLETVQTAITRLGNGFQSLSQALGTEGGFLTGAKLTLDTLTKLVDVITQLTTVAGKAGPVLLATMAAASYFGKGTRGAGAVSGVGDFFGGIFQNSSILSGIANKRYGGTPGQPNLYPQTMGYEFGTKLTKGAGFIAPAISAGLNLAQGDIKGAGGNIAGAILAGLTTGFNPIAMSVGSLIGESFINVVGGWMDTAQRDAAATLIPSATGQEPGAPKKTQLQLLQEAKDKQKQALYEQVYELAGQGDVARGKLRSGLFAGFAGLSQQQTAVGLAARNAFSEEDKAKLEDLIKQIDALDKSFTRNVDNITERESVGIQEGIRDALKERTKPGEADFFTQYAQEQSNKALQGLTRGEISAKEQRNVVSSLPGLPAASLQMYSALGGTADDVGKLAQEITGMSSQEDVLRRLMDLLIKAPEEATLYIKTLAGDINDLKDAIKEAQEAGAPVTFQGQEFTSAASAMELLTKKTDEYKSALKGMYIEMARSSIKVPDVQSFEDVTSKQMQEIIKSAREAQKEEYQSILPELSDQQLQEYFAGFEPYFAKTKEDYQKIFELDPKFLQEEYQKAVQAGKVATKNIDFGFFDAQKYRMAEQYYAQTAANLSKLGYKEDTTPQIVALSDGTIQKTTKDSKIMSLLMSQLVDLSEKQLDGIYNLPTSASFYVPSQAAGMAGRGGGGGIDTSGLERLANATVIGAETPAQPTTNALGQATTANYSKFLEEEQKRIEAESQIAVAQLLTQTQKTGEYKSQEAKVNRLDTEQAKKADTFAWLEQYDQKRAMERNQAKVDRNQLYSFDMTSRPQPGALPPTPPIEETGFLKNMMDSFNNLKVNSQLELKQNITANVAVILNQAQVGRAVAKYLEEQQLIFSQNSITKNTVI